MISRYANQTDCCKTDQVLWKLLDEQKYLEEKLTLHNCYIFLIDPMHLV